VEELMRKILIVLAIAFAAAAAAGAEDMLSPAGLQDEINAALQDLSAAPVGTLTVGDFAKVAARLSIAQQKVSYVMRAQMASMMVPGAGQFLTGDTTAGVLFLAGDIAVMAGAMVGAYFLLPANVQAGTPGGLDYLNDPLSTVKARWEGNSFLSYLPSWGVMAGGMLLKGVLGHFSATAAGKTARANIADGKVTFTPSFGFMGRGFGMGMGMKF
jgi:hypothetical protein